MGTSRRQRGLGALALLTVVVAACAEPLAHGDRAVHYDGIGELVASADAASVPPLRLSGVVS